jgi:hypothetical protein
MPTPDVRQAGSTELLRDATAAERLIEAVLDCRSARDPLSSCGVDLVIARDRAACGPLAPVCLAAFRVAGGSLSV